MVGTLADGTVLEGVVPVVAAIADVFSGTEPLVPVVASVTLGAVADVTVSSLAVVGVWVLGVVVCVVGGPTVGTGAAGATVMWSIVDVGAARRSSSGSSPRWSVVRAWVMPAPTPVRSAAPPTTARAMVRRDGVVVIDGLLSGVGRR